MTKLKVGLKFLLLAFGIVSISAFPTDEKLGEPVPADSSREADNSNRGRFNGKSGNVDNLHSNGTPTPIPHQTEANSTAAPSVAEKESVTVVLPVGTTVETTSATTMTTVAPPPGCGGNLQQLPPPVPVVPIGPGPNIGNGYPPLESLVQQVVGNHGKNETQQQVIVLLVPLREQQPEGAPVGAGDLRSVNEMAPRSAGEEPDQGGMML